MSQKKRERITKTEPFSAVSTNKKQRLFSKIIKLASLQRNEIRQEEEQTINNATNNNTIVFPNVSANNNSDDDDVNAFDGFSETHTQFGLWDIQDEMLKEDEDNLESFLSKDYNSQTLADIILKKIKQRDSIIELYKGVGQLLSKYTSGNIPKGFKHIPSLQMWEEVLLLTEPEKWSPNAMYQATRIFASNMGVKKVERFYKFVLLPRVRQDIRDNERLHFALYQSLNKALYKPAAFNKGILFPLCESKTCNLREALIVGSIIEKASIPPLHSSVALLKLAQMEYCGTTSYFINLLIEKKYALPYRVLDVLVAHFMRFYDDSRIMPVIWHQSLLAFAQRYKNELTKDDKADLNTLLERQSHELVTPEILRELKNSRNRGEKEEDLMSISTPVHVVNETTQEDRFDIPDVPIEED